ncbi:hypothetical protein TRIUR3_11184 [Triticum urartu]|uniref:Uncharacterized protein n=1 Tax=Triticum urartu TaxID=4572 RepID=M7Z3P5_TRIUA|nr:hypothetical protein TRIUR3_11184 [Triticum urartu]
MVGLSSCLMPLTGFHYERSSRTTSSTQIRFPRSCCQTAEPALPFLQTQILDLVALNSSAAMGMIWQDFESAVVRMHHRRGYGWTVSHQMTMDSKVTGYRVDWLKKGQIEHLRKKIAYEIVNMKGNKGDTPEFLYEEIID